MNITINDYAMQDTNIRSAVKRAKMIEFVMALLKENKEMPRLEVEKEVFERFLQSEVPSPLVLEDFLVSQGLIRTENRKEETITVFDKETVYYNKKNERVPATIDAIIVSTGEKCKIANPLISKCRCRWEKVKKEIQVTRKYWVWVA